MGKKIIILGGSGFVGSHLQAHLNQAGIITVGLSSTQLDLTSTTTETKLKEVICPDDTVVFASCITREKGGDDLPTLMKNLKMAEQVGGFVEKYRCAYLIYLSSDAVYKEGLPLINEGTEKDPTGLYGITHVTREKMMESSAQKAGVPLLILRPSAVYGEGDTHNGYGPNRFLRTALTERKITLFGEGEEKRDHLFVGDLCRLIELCLSHHTEGLLNVATGRSASFYEVAQQAAQLVGSPVEIKCQPRKSPITHRAFDITQLIKKFPSFSFVSLEEGLRRSKTNG